MKEIKYQQKYVRELVDMTIDLLRLSGHRKTLIFKAPTGSTIEWGLVHVSQDKKASPPTPLPRRGE
jgi:hypothetical protein